MSAYGDEVFKSGIETFHPPDDDTASIKSDVLDDKDQNSQPLSPANEDLNCQPLHPPDTYDKLGQPLHPPDTYDKLGQPLHPPDTYDKLGQPPSDIYDKLIPQKVRYVIWLYISTYNPNVLLSQVYIM